MKKLAILESVVLAVMTALPVMAASPPSMAGQNQNAARLPEIQQVVFVDYAQHSSPPPASDQDKSFRLFRHASWATLPISYKVNADGAPAGAIAAVIAAFGTWDAESSAGVFSYDAASPTNTGYVKDNENVVSWAYIDGSGGAEDIVAVCSVWFEVRPSGWQVVEFGIVFDSGNSWAIGPVTNHFDVQNVATHEAGHALFLDDLYLWKTAELTMYGYVGYAEIKKRTLGVGDVLGIQKLYGP